MDVRSGRAPSCRQASQLLSRGQGDTADTDLLAGAMAPGLKVAFQSPIPGDEIPFLLGSSQKPTIRRYL
jgi:hypothetical protein